MDYILKLFAIDYVNLLSEVIVIVLGLVVVKEAFEKFCRVFGIEFAWIREKNERAKREKKINEDLDSLNKQQQKMENLREEDANRLSDLKNDVASLKSDIKTLADSIDKREAEKRFLKLRSDILKFANEIASAKYVSPEMVDQIYEDIEEYELLSKKYKFKNNRVNVSVKLIQDKYEELLRQGMICKKSDVECEEDVSDL